MKLSQAVYEYNPRLSIYYRKPQCNYKGIITIDAEFLLRIHFNILEIRTTILLISTQQDNSYEKSR
jgi:hypothetical protein